MKTLKVITKEEKAYDKHTFEVYKKDVNYYLVELTDKEYTKARKIFKE